MTGTYLDMQTRIGDEVQDSTAILANIKLAILDAIKLYRGTRFYFNQKTITFSTVANQEYYATADNSDIPNLVEIDSAVVTNSGVKTEVIVVPFEDIDVAQSGSAISIPRAIAYFNQSIRCYPIPDAVYTMTLAVFYRLADLSADSDTNAWMTDAEIVIRQCAKRLLAGDVIQESGIAQAAGPIEMQALDVLMKETRRRRSVSNLRTDVSQMGYRRGGFDINSGQSF